MDLINFLILIIIKKNPNSYLYIITLKKKLVRYNKFYLKKQNKILIIINNEFKSKLKL